MWTNLTSEFLICPPEVVFDRAQNVSTSPKFGGLKACSSCNAIVYMWTNLTSQFLICPPQVAFDRAQNGPNPKLKKSPCGQYFALEI